MQVFTSKERRRLLPLSMRVWQTVMRSALIALAVGSFLTSSGSGQAADAPSTPFLRLASVAHTAAINRIALSPNGLYVASASDDKTIEVLAVATGRLVARLRPPIGDGNEGKLYAVAISPDGETVACAGDTGHAWNNSYCIYLFSLHSERLVGRMTGLPSAILHLAYSSDGKHLAAGTSEKGGLHVFRTTDLTLEASDQEYADDCQWVDYAKDGRLVTVSLDGQVRLYGSEMNRIAAWKAPKDKRPWSAAFSPDGKQVAVGLKQDNAITVLSGSRLDAPVIRGVTGGQETSGDLKVVCWSPDGDALYAAGTFNRDGHSVLCRWKSGNREPAVETPLPVKEFVSDLNVLDSGAAVYCTEQATIGLAAPQRGTRVLSENQSPDFRQLRLIASQLAVSPDGRKVQFLTAEKNGLRARFDLAHRTLDVVSGGKDRAAADMLPPVGTRQNLNPAEELKLRRQVEAQPPLNGKEPIRSLAFSEDRSTFVLGTSLALIRPSQEGSVWHTFLPAEAWQINICRNGKIVVAALGDGTIRWYSMADGRELLALYALPARNVWALWTPGGYYDASPGGEELVGWHVNRSATAAADFYSIGRFRADYYRPDIVGKILDTLTEPDAVKVANASAGRVKPAEAVEQSLPPVVQIVSPLPGEKVATDEITVRYRVRSTQSAPILEVKPVIDGHNVDLRRIAARQTIVQDGETIQEMRVQIPHKDCTIALVARNAHGSSDPFTTQVLWNGISSEKKRGKLYLLAVGISDYDDPEHKLTFPAKDAHDFTETMRAQKEVFYRDVDWELLTDKKASKQGIKEALARLETHKKQVEPEDTVMLYLAGHGDNGDNQKYYFLPSDMNPDKIDETGVDGEDILKAAQFPCRVVIFIDTCHSGNILKASGRSADIMGFINKAHDPDNGIVVMAATDKEGTAREEARWGNGAFTKELVEALQGKANKVNGEVSFLDVYVYIDQHLPILTDNTQKPTLGMNGMMSNFSLARIP